MTFCSSSSGSGSGSGSGTVVYFVETSKHMQNLFTIGYSHTILIFLHQVIWQYSVGNPLTGALNTGGV